jgi:hypothetical protein
LFLQFSPELQVSFSRAFLIMGGIRKKISFFSKVSEKNKKVLRKKRNKIVYTPHKKHPTNLFLAAAQFN